MKCVHLWILIIDEKIPFTHRGGLLEWSKSWSQSHHLLLDANARAPLDGTAESPVTGAFLLQRFVPPSLTTILYR